MSFRRSRGRMRRRRFSKSTAIQHSPSTMDQQMATNISSVIIAVAANNTAGTSATSGRLDTDRDRSVSNGEKIGQITYTVQLEPASAAQGTIEYICWRTERSQVTPSLTNQLPTSAEDASEGIQQAYRLRLPGWVMRFGAIGIAAEQPRVINIKVSPSRLGMPGIRDGDFTGITLHNRTNGTVNFSVQMRYKSFR